MSEMPKNMIEVPKSMMDAAENISNNLKRLMRLHGHLSLSEVSRATQIPQPTLHHVLSGMTKRPRRKLVQALASYFSVSIDQLLGHQALPDFIPNRMQESYNITSVPVIDWYQVRMWPNYSVREGSQHKQIILEKATNFHGFASILEMEHPEPIFPRGTIVVFDTDRKASNGDYVLVYFARDDRMQLVKLSIQNGTQYLSKYNNHLAVTQVAIDPYNDRIVGTLVESRVRYGLSDL